MLAGKGKLLALNKLEGGESKRFQGMEAKAQAGMAKKGKAAKPKPDTGALSAFLSKGKKKPKTYGD